MKRIYRTIGITAVLIITVLFGWYAAQSLHGHDLSVYATPRAAIGIALAAACWCASIPLLGVTWRYLLGALDVHRSRRELTAILGITQFAKYVPGNVAQYIGRVGMSLARGIPARPLAATMILETVMVVGAAVVVGLGTGILSRAGLDVVRHHSSQLVLVIVLLLIAMAGLFAFPRVAPKLLKRFAPRYAPVLDGTLLPSRSALAKAFVPCCCTYLVVGLGLVLLALFLLPGAPHDGWLLIAAFSLAWVVGFVTPGSPGGLGVREGLMLLMLAPAYTAASASVLVIALRIATTLGDIMILGAGFLLLPKRQLPSTPSLPP